jgi:hypothetical protein
MTLAEEERAELVNTREIARSKGWDGIWRWTSRREQL